MKKLFLITDFSHIAFIPFNKNLSEYQHWNFSHTKYITPKCINDIIYLSIFYLLSHGDFQKFTLSTKLHFINTVRLSDHISSQNQCLDSITTVNHCELISGDLQQTYKYESNLSFITSCFKIRIHNNLKCSHFGHLKY